MHDELKKFTAEAQRCVNVTTINLITPGVEFAKISCFRVHGE
jgi:hypothetical protein